MTDINQNYGGYRKLKSYQMATLVYDLTMEFCKAYIRPTSRTRDQMEQAARSGQKNIAEGSKASRTSKKSELKLVNVARGSLEELLGDYEDCLRQNGLKQWGKDDPAANKVRRLAYRSDKSCTTYMSYLENLESAANALVCLINQTNYLLDQQIKVLEKDLLIEGDVFDKTAYRDRAKNPWKYEMLKKQKEEDEWLAEQVAQIKSDRSDTTNRTNKTNKTDRIDP